MKSRILCNVFFLLLIFQTSSFAESYHAIDTTAWKKAVDGLDYSETPPEDTEQIAPQTQQAVPVVSKTVQVILFVVVTALLIYLMLRIFGKDIFRKNKLRKTSDSVSIEDLDDKPMETDLEKFLREALLQKNYRLAVRIYYLMSLQALHEKEIITWKKNKTNREYVLETSGNIFSQQFAGNTVLFEYVWYGEKLMEETQFNSVHSSFVHLIETIRKSKQ